MTGTLNPYPSRQLGWLLVLLLPLLAACSEQLPDCVLDAQAVPPEEPSGPPAAAPLKDATELLVGIDGSGSMLGHARAADPSAWAKVLQSVNLTARTEGLSLRSVRVGGGSLQPFGNGSVTPAADPCFFEGCAPYAAVASSLQTLWQQPTQKAQLSKGQLPLRLIVSDLEVNQSDISNLVGAIRTDLARGAAAGVLAIKLPFQGQVFNAAGRVIHTGRVERPVYLLATGKPQQVRSLLEGIRRTLGLKGVSVEQHLSIFDPGSKGEPLLAKSILGIPASTASTGQPLRLEGKTFSPSTNPDYKFIRLGPQSTGILVATAKGMGEGSSRPDPGLLRIEAIPLPPANSASSGGVRLRSLSIDGSNLRAALEIDASTSSGLLRATIPRGGLPEPWWFDWDRSQPAGKQALSQTDGLLLLLSTLSQQVQYESKTPAVALCVAFQRS